MGFIVETPPVLRHKPHRCDLPETIYYDEKQNLFKPSYAHLTIWQCDECKKYWKYMDFKRDMFYPTFNEWKLISERKALKLKSKWLIKQL